MKIKILCGVVGIFLFLYGHERVWRNLRRRLSTLPRKQRPSLIAQSQKTIIRGLRRNMKRP